MSVNIFARPIIPILVTYMAGIVLGVRFPGYGGWAIGTIVLGLAAVGWRLWQQRATYIAPMILFLAMGYLSIQPWIAPDFPSHHVIHHADSQKWTITGIIAEHPVVRPKRQSLIVEATDIKTKDRHYEVCRPGPDHRGGRGPDRFKPRGSYPCYGPAQKGLWISIIRVGLITNVI